MRTSNFNVEDFKQFLIWKLPQTITSVLAVELINVSIFEQLPGDNASMCNIKSTKLPECDYADSLVIMIFIT